MYTGYFVVLTDEEKNNYQPKSKRQLQEEGFLLKNILISQVPQQTYRRIKFDFVGGEDDWDGYSIGFLYEDGKFLGKFHYVKTLANNSLESTLDGRFIETEHGIEIRGDEYYNNKKNCFYIVINNELEEKSATKIKKEPVIIKLQDPINTILNKEAALLLFQRAESIKKKSKNNSFDLYQPANRLRLQPHTEDALFTAVSLAYSWMPTMLELFPKNGNNLAAELKAVQALQAIKSVSDFEQKEKEIQQHLELLTNAINHSIVGASKTLHLFYPDIVPILDSRVLKAWNKFFGKYYKKHPALKLVQSVPYYSNRQVPLFMKYWKLMLQWKENAGCKTVRELEEALYLLGK